MKGSYCHEKELNLDILLQSRYFRQGILEGYYLADGGNSNRIYTTSPKMAEHIEILITSLGLQSIIDISDRTDEPVIIRGEVFQRNYPLYCVRWYNIGNKRGVQDIYKVRNNSVYFKISSIELIDYGNHRDVYCFEIENEDEPYFTLPNGVITHNCRLKNEIEVNPFAYSLGGTGMMTGSMKVITLNMNRIIQDGIDLPEKVRDVHRYLIAFRMLMQEMEDARLLPAYDEGYISLDKQYVTVGINGMVEAAEFLGYEISPNDDYLGWVKTIFDTISTENKVSAKHYTELLGRNVMINTELVPAENLGVKFAKWDKKDGYVVPRDCYNSYLYKVEDDTLDFADKFTMHGGDVLQYLDGGSSVHLNFNEIPNAGTWKKIMQKAIDAGSSYWTYNVKSTCCNKCGYIDMNTRNMCSKCGSADVDYATRIIGYLKKIKSFSEPRQREAGLRYYHKN
jgi:ribonucleoside-triphosphate reductase